MPASSPPCTRVHDQAAQCIARLQPHQPAGQQASEPTFPQWIKQQQWDGVPRLYTWLADVLRLPQTAYFGLIGRYLVLGHAARALRPGCPFPFTPVMFGAPGAGKSLLPRLLVGNSHFSDEYIHLGAKAPSPTFTGAHAQEVALPGVLTLTELARLKTMLCATHDLHRTPYSAKPSLTPRSFVMWITTNDPHQLLAYSSHRLLWSIYVPNVIDTERLQVLRSQLFAEAHTLLHRGHSHLPTGEEQACVIKPGSIAESSRAWSQQ